MPNGSIERYCLPLHTIGYTNRLIVKLILPKNGEILSNESEKAEKAYATVKMNEARLQ